MGRRQKAGRPGQPAQIFISAVVVLGTVALILWAVVFVLMEDFMPISLKMEEERVGSSMENMKKGSFMDSDYNSCLVCLRSQNPPFLKIVTKDGRIYYLNDEDCGVTQEVYEGIVGIK